MKKWHYSCLYPETSVLNAGEKPIISVKGYSEEVRKQCPARFNVGKRFYFFVPFRSIMDLFLGKFEMKIWPGFILIIVGMISLIISTMSQSPLLPSGPEDLFQIFKAGSAMTLATLCIASFWIWMFFDFFDRKANLKNSRSITYLFFLLNWIGSIIYFFVIYCPRVRKEADHDLPGDKGD